MDQERIWNDRYRAAGADYFYGTSPNRFLAERVARFSRGESVLSVADGEGRNSVWLARQGLKVAAIDISPVGVAKAQALAAAHGATVDFTVGDILAQDWPPPGQRASFDWVVAIFVQFVGPETRPRQFAALRAAVRPGGRLLLHGYTPKQVEFATGGPSAVENLYTRELLLAAFGDWRIEELIDYEDQVSEGSGHCGRSALIGMVARKPDA